MQQSDNALEMRLMVICEVRTMGHLGVHCNPRCGLWHVLADVLVSFYVFTSLDDPVMDLFRPAPSPSDKGCSMF